MTLISSTKWLAQAHSEKWAIGAFNANTLEQVEAITNAAQEELSPVIMQFSHRALQYIGSGNSMTGLQYAAEIGRVAAQSVDIPFALHLDHGTELEITQAIELGFTSVMFDGSLLPFKENLQKSKNLCNIAHQAGVNFEAELGAVPKPENNEVCIEDDLTDPKYVVEFVEKTELDSLAISIGTVHGKKNQQLDLNFELLDSIRNLVNVPLVLHGASGVTDKSILEGIQHGLSKINIATQLNLVFTRTIQDFIHKYPEESDPRKYLQLARQAVKEHVKTRIRIFGSAGRYQG